MKNGIKLEEKVSLLGVVIIMIRLIVRSMANCIIGMQ
jgi:hypothetical protein